MKVSDFGQKNEQSRRVSHWSELLKMWFFLIVPMSRMVRDGTYMGIVFSIWASKCTITGFWSVAGYLFWLGYRILGALNQTFPFGKILQSVYIGEEWSFFRIDPSDILHRYTAAAGADPDIDIPDDLQDLCHGKSPEFSLKPLFFLDPEDQF